MIRKLLISALCLVGAAALTHAPPASAADSPISGAIFTTDSSGVPVNLNHYPSKESVYLNGGPGMNAPDGAAGLPPGTYSFQVTDPSGKTLLSTDDVRCRQIVVGANGVFSNALSTGPCPAHLQGLDGEDGGATVQLFPYNDTPNNGGVYKVWMTPTAQLNCDTAGNKFCFVPGESKTDNYKVKATSIVEIDTRFNRDGALVDGLAATWTDTLGASNIKYSEYNPAILAFHEAHVEAVEEGTHYITVTDQPGCTIRSVTGPKGSKVTKSGSTYTVAIAVKKSQPGDNTTYFVDVWCA